MSEKTFPSRSFLAQDRYGVCHVRIGQNRPEELQRGKAI